MTAVKMSYLYGARAGTWLGLLRRHRPWRDRRSLRAQALTQAATITVSSLLNSWLHRRDTLDATTRSHRTGDSGPAVSEPVFVIGHWRSGTTHLQYLLARDPRLASPTTYDVCFPNSLLTGERWHAGLISRLLPATRLQDDMAFGIDVPNEDEIALAALGLPSPYHYWGFPGGAHERYLTFADAPHADRQRFVDGLEIYLRKLTAKYGRRLLLKSPTHTARLELLLERFPDARFILIHRHPHDVFRSTRHLHRAWLDGTAFLQDPGLAARETQHGRRALDQRILSLYRELFDAYFEERPRVPAGQLVELAYDELVADPINTLAGAYDHLSLGALPERELRAYLKTQTSYRTNTYPQLEEADKRRVFAACPRAFEEWGYGV